MEWKSNDGGQIKVRELIALCWIPLSLLELPDGIRINANHIYRNKAVCVDAYNKLLKHADVSTSVEEGYDFQITNESIRSAIEIGASLCVLYDKLYEKFPQAYNSSGGSFGKINAVKMYDKEKIGEKNQKYLRNPAKTPFLRKNVKYTCPDGFLVPFIYGMRSLMEVDENGIVTWKHDPNAFIEHRLVEAMNSYRLAS